MELAVEVTRGELVECRHRAIVSVTDSSGDLVSFLGDYNNVIYARSSVKPMQAIQVLETGAVDKYNISQDAIALFCASHAGEVKHTDLALKILNSANLDDTYLQCGVHVQGNTQIYKEMIESGVKLNQLHNNCSGKHSGMLISAMAMNEDLTSYLNINHPIQQRILSDIAYICDYPKENIAIGIDGCGAPVHGLPLYNLSYGYARMADSSKLADKRKYIDKVVDSMLKHPDIVAGKDRFCTSLMEICGDRIFGKVGAQGVYLLGDRKNKIGIAIKVEDGSRQAVECVVMEVLKQLNLITCDEYKQLENYAMPKLKNAKSQIIGYMRSRFTLNKY